MGLPMWKDSDDEEVIQNAAAKLDRAAAARRSAIRREASVRPGRDATNLSRYEALRDASQNMSRTRGAPYEEEVATDERILQLQNELERLRRIRMRARYRPNRERESTRAGRDTRSPNSGTGRSSPARESDGSRSAETTPTATLVETIQQHLPRPTRESNLRFVFPSSRSGSSSPWRYQWNVGSQVLSPPHSAGSNNRDRSIPDGPLPLEDTSMPALTEGFAPARSTSQTALRGGESTRLDEDDFRGLETPPPESWEASYPPLRRVNHLSPRMLPRFDGLGDRRRSPSPLSDGHEESTWTNLLTTMSNERSSTATSFMSTDQSDSQPSQRSSQNTHTSFGEIGSVDDGCELDLPPGITEEDVLAMRAQHRPRHSNRMSGVQAYLAHRAALDVDAGLSREERLSQTESELQLRAQHERLIQATLARGRRREELPDHWWAMVGLSPDQLG